MIACDSEDCEFEWFRYECIGMSVNNISNGDWFCEECKIKIGQGHLFCSGVGGDG